MDIESFSGEYRFLSNFYPCPVNLDGLQFPSVEHAYQAAKTLDPDARLAISLLPKPGQAKHAGKALQLRAGWDGMRLDVMRGLLLQKFAYTPFANALKATHPWGLIEGNNWGDTFWGVCNGRGKNHLGRLLMEIRLQLIKGEQ